jgi:hypothetical protein
MCPAMDSSTWDKKFGSLLITDCTVLLTILTAATKKTIQRRQKYYRRK